MYQVILSHLQRIHTQLNWTQNTNQHKTCKTLWITKNIIRIQTSYLRTSGRGCGATQLNRNMTFETEDWDNLTWMVMECLTTLQWLPKITRENLKGGEKCICMCWGTSTTMKTLYINGTRPWIKRILHLPLCKPGVWIFNHACY